MNRLMRMAYGRSGSRLEKILVSAPQAESAAGQRWLALLSAALLVAVPVIVCRYGTPPPVERQTVVDMSRLTVTHASLPEELQIPRRQPQLEQRPLPTAKPAEASAKAEEKPPEQRAPLPAEEMCRPVITRPSAQTVSADQGHQPRIARERLRVAVDSASPLQPRVRRDSPVLAALQETASITRTRQVVAADLTGGVKVTAPQKRSAALADESSAGKDIRVVRRGVPSSSGAEASAPRIAAVRERSAAVEGTGSGKTLSVGLSRGVSLAGLGVCSSPQREEEAIRAVLRVIGARRSCSDARGEYQFTGTKRVSSFNLTIFPAEGRTPSNRCEELGNAYACLQTR